MQLLLILRDLLVFGLLFAVPGLLVTRAALADADPLERAVVALGAGFGGVSVLAFTFSLLTLTHLSWIHVTIAAAVVATVAWRRGGRIGSGSGTGPLAQDASRALASLASGRSRLPLVLILTTFVVFLVNYDRAHFQYGCIHTVVQLALDDQVEIGSPFTDAGTPQERVAQNRRRTDPNPIRGEREVPPEWMNPLVFIGDTGQRYGTTAMIAPAAAVHGFFGFRLVYALHAALLAAFLFLIGRVLTANDRLAALAAALAVLNPWLLKISLLDENLMSAAWAAGAVWLALKRAPLLAGLFCGLALGIRHIDLGLAVGVAVILWGAIRADRWKQAAKPLLLGLLWALLHEAVHHQVAYGTLLSHEHFVDEVWFHTTYEVFGRTFEYAGLLNWPFADTVVRTPYNGFPTFLLVPLSIVAHLGALLVGIALIGLLRLREHARLGLALMVWALPIVGLHAVLEDWLDPNKMGIPVTLQPVLAIGIVLGIAAIAERPKVWGPAALVITAALAIGTRAAGSLETPDDPAFYVKYPLVRVEEPVYADEDRRRWSRGNVLPDWRWIAQHSPFAPGARLRALWGELGDRDLRQGPLPPRPAPDPTGDAVIGVDLATPWVGRRDFLAPTTGAAIDLRTPGAVLIDDLEIPWADRPGALLAVHEDDGRIRLFLRFGLEDFGDFESVEGFTIDAAQRDVRTVTASGPVRLRVPTPAVIEVAETVSLDQVLIYRWDGRVTAEGIALSDWRKLFHN